MTYKYPSAEGNNYVSFSNYKQTFKKFESRCFPATAKANQYIVYEIKVNIKRT